MTFCEKRQGSAWSTLPYFMQGGSGLPFYFAGSSGPARRKYACRENCTCLKAAFCRGWRYRDGRAGQRKGSWSCPSFLRCTHALPRQTKSLFRHVRQGCSTGCGLWTRAGCRRMADAWRPHAGRGFGASVMSWRWSPTCCQGERGIKEKRRPGAAFARYSAEPMRSSQSTKVLTMAGVCLLRGQTA